MNSIIQDDLFRYEGLRSKSLMGEDKIFFLHARIPFYLLF